MNVTNQKKKDSDLYSHVVFFDEVSSLVLSSVCPCHVTSANAS